MRARTDRSPFWRREAGTWARSPGHRRLGRRAPRAPPSRQPRVANPESPSPRRQLAPSRQPRVAISESPTPSRRPTSGPNPKNSPAPRAGPEEPRARLRRHGAPIGRASAGTAPLHTPPRLPPQRRAASAASALVTSPHRPQRLSRAGAGGPGPAKATPVTRGPFVCGEGANPLPLCNPPPPPFSHGGGEVCV